MSKNSNFDISISRSLDLSQKNRSSERFQLSKERIGAAFAHGSSYGSLPNFVSECRLNASVKLLSGHPQMLITEVARRCGYADASTFTSKFKKHFSVPPSEFLKRPNSVAIS